MWASLVLVALSQIAPGPLDGFRANYASIRAEVTFQYGEGKVVPTGARLWEGRIPSYSVNPDVGIVGKWACDGSAEYYRFSSPEETLERARNDVLRHESGKTFFNVPFVSMTEAIWNGEILCGHTENPHQRRSGGDPNWKVVSAQVVGESLGGILSEGRGPFLWNFGLFPHLLKVYQGVVPTRDRAIRWGNATEVEVYRRQLPGDFGWDQLEVSYDPSVGYLPRFVRRVMWYKGTATVIEQFMTEAKPCAAGGFVPVEWYAQGFSIDNFESRFPDYNHNTDLKYPEKGAGLGHFRATAPREFRGPVALVDTKNVNMLTGIGGHAPLAATGAALTFADMERKLGRALREPIRRPLATLDTAELDELQQSGSGTWQGYIVAMTLLVAASVMFLLLRRPRKRLLLTIFLACQALVGSGCGRIGSPVIKVSASYSQPVVYVESAKPELPMSLVLKNEGNIPVRVSRVDGGCTCRQVDQSSLPFVIGPSQTHQVTIRLSAGSTTKQELSHFSVETDHGVLPVRASFLLLVGHELEPEAIATPYLNENDKWSFDFTHRSILPVNASKDESELRFPPEFSVIKQNSSSGAVNAAPDYRYEDDRYHVELQDAVMGDRKSEIQLLSGAGDVLQRVPVVWKRVPFLSSVPDRVVLGTRPVRVFLRCPDERVELTKILSTPDGVRAVISSTRELTILPTDEMPGTVNGNIQVETTAPDKKRLVIQVVRYTSEGSRTAAN